MVAASRDAQKNLQADDADDADGAAGRTLPTCPDDSDQLPCVQKCKNRLKKCMLPWEKKKCGKTSTEECLARYVCCIDDYCCEEPECPEGTCVNLDGTCPNDSTGCDCCPGLECDVTGTKTCKCPASPTVCIDVCCPAGEICGASGSCETECTDQNCVAGGAECPNAVTGCDCCQGSKCDVGTTNTCVSCVDTGGAPVDTCAVCCDENAICKVVGNSKFKCKCEGAECDTGCCPAGKSCNADSICEDFPFGCETAFAKDPANGICFQDLANSDPTFKRWGWTNGPYTAGTFDLDIYGGAAQCDITKGQQKVGKATVMITGNTVTVTLTPNDPTDTVNGDPGLAAFKFTEYHIQVSCDPEQHALNGVTPTVAPGLYTVVKNEAVASGVTVTTTFGAGESFPIDSPGTTTCALGYWVIIHAVSCLES